MPHETRADWVRLKLEDDIIHTRRRAGDVLDERSLAAEFGVSRTPVREAIRRLAASGMVLITPHRGTVVADISAKLEETFAVWAELESLCAAWSAERMSPDERRQLEAAQQDCARAAAVGDCEAYERANAAFHDLLYAGSHNSTLAELVRSFRQRIAPFRRAQFELFGCPSHAVAEHEIVVRAVLRGDRQGAGDAMRSHIVIVRHAIDEVSRFADERRVQPGSRGR